jgi:hypothetical protein
MGSDNVPHLAYLLPSLISSHRILEIGPELQSPVMRHSATNNQPTNQPPKTTNHLNLPTNQPTNQSINKPT